MVPLASVVRVRETTAPQVISHYNLFRSAEINGVGGARRRARGRRIAEMERLAAATLPQGFGYAWSGMSLEEIKAGGQSAAIFGIGIAAGLPDAGGAVRVASSCRSSCCWACRWRCSARCRRSGCAVCRTTCTARSGW